jgi:hypothetical protein
VPIPLEQSTVRISVRALTAAGLALPLALLATAPASAAPKAKRHASSIDATAPTVAIMSPANGSTTGTSLTVSGAASDNTSVASVSLQVDGGAWQLASGTTSWSAALAGLGDGAHSVTARASDKAGNTGTATVSFTVSAPAPAPTTSPSPSPSPSPTASPSPSPSPTVSPSPTPTSTSGSSSAPTTQGTWKSPEGVTIVVNSAGPWTIAQVYTMLKDNAIELSTVGANYTINVQDQYASMTTTMVDSTGGTYSDFSATTYLKGVNSTFVTWPDYVLAHEYGIVWTQYHRFLQHGGDWSSYLANRWDNADGSTRLAQDSRLYSSQTWQPAEIIADDYRLLFGSPAAISEYNWSVNTAIPDPRNQPGLASWFLSTWA